MPENTTHALENEHLRVRIRTAGAELDSIFHKTHRIEYLWQADPVHWAKKSPVLFPVVGTLKDNTYVYDGRPYSLPRHGFARERIFSVAARQPDLLLLRLEADSGTYAAYPFAFALTLEYRLHADILSVAYAVENPGPETLYFSVGGHPAFNVPLVPGTRYDDYYLAFDQSGPLQRWPLTGGGLVGLEPVPVAGQHPSGQEVRLPLTHTLFHDDALVFKHLQATRVALRSPATPHGLEMEFEGFPYFGVWAARNADFVCLEPWCGIADAVDATQRLPEKEGIVALPPQAQWRRAWQVRLF